MKTRVEDDTNHSLLVWQKHTTRIWNCPCHRGWWEPSDAFSPWDIASNSNSPKSQTPISPWHSWCGAVPAAGISVYHVFFHMVHAQHTAYSPPVPCYFRQQCSRFAIETWSVIGICSCSFSLQRGLGKLLSSKNSFCPMALRHPRCREKYSAEIWSHNTITGKYDWWLFSLSEQSMVLVAYVWMSWICVLIVLIILFCLNWVLLEV